MRRIISCCCFLFLFGINVVYAQAIRKLQLSLLTGYEQQNLTWSIAGNAAGQSPNVFSELQFKNVGGQSVSGALQWNVWDRLILTADYARVFIKTGTVADNDYNSDNRTDPAYAQVFNADKGYNQAWSAGAGYHLFNNNTFSFVPSVGYSISRQSLFLLDRTGNFPDLNSTYETNWKGPFIKATALLRLINKLKLNANLAYNQVNYSAKADWNLIQNFQHPVSYRHTAKGFGVDANAGLVYDITRNVAVNLGGGYFTWQTGKGVDELFLNSGESDKTQLNKVDRKGYRLFGGLVLSY